MSSEKKNSRLGKGLSALIGEYDAFDDLGSDDGLSAKVVDTIAITDVQPNPGQPRKQFDENKLAELVASVKVHGVLTPILVREIEGKDYRFQIIAGERRWRASKRAGLDTIPARILKSNDLQILEIGLIENIQREDLNPIEEAEGYRALISRFGKTQESLAESLGKSRTHITNMMRLLQLPESVREHVSAGHISAGHARAVINAENPEAIIEDVIAKGLSVRETEKLVQRERNGTKISASAPSSEKDVDTEALEADLTRLLGLEVDIRNSAKGGELRIKYRHLEQLDDICRRLSRGA